MKQILCHHLIFSSAAVQGNQCDNLVQLEAQILCEKAMKLEIANTNKTAA